MLEGDVALTAEYLMLMHFLKRIDKRKQEKAIRYIIKNRKKMAAGVFIMMEIVMLVFRLSVILPLNWQVIPKKSRSCERPESVFLIWAG